METKLVEFDRVRKLYEKYVSWDPTNSQAWIHFAETEEYLQDIERARAIFEIAISQDSLDAPEAVWKRFIDFETALGEFERARDVYERLLEKVQHFKVFTTYASWEVTQANNERDVGVVKGRKIFERANEALKEARSKLEVRKRVEVSGKTRLRLTFIQRTALLQSWRDFELEYGDAEHIKLLDEKMPKRIKKRRRLDDDSFEEYEDWMFPSEDEGTAKKAANILSMAIGQDDSDDSSDDD